MGSYNLKEGGCMRLPDFWLEILHSIRLEYEPIIDTFSGITYGFEVFFWGAEKQGFKSFEELKERALLEKILVPFELELRKKAVFDFMSKGLHEKHKLFYPFDSRILYMPDFIHRDAQEDFGNVNLLSELFVLQISQEKPFSDSIELNAMVSIYAKHGYTLMFDRYGDGGFNFRHLYEIRPHFVRLDPYFIQNIEKSPKKRLFVSHLMRILKVLGITVIAPQVESKKVYFLLKELSVDLIQGKLIQERTHHQKELKSLYPQIQKLYMEDKRGDHGGSEAIRNLTDLIPPVYKAQDMLEVLELFRQHKNYSFFPILDPRNEPLGIIKDSDLKDYVYSAYGTSLLRNKSASKKSVLDFLSPCPTADVHTPLETLIETFANRSENEGIILTENSKYVGFLNSKALISAINERNLLIARDQNPLTKLPGNNLISRHISDCFMGEESFALVYFDFDNFKPFNDKYGFRSGDRAILMFSDLMRERLEQKGYFIGHIGGDDFFCACKEEELQENLIPETLALLQKFAQDAKLFYSDEEREAGYVMLSSREGEKKRFPLLSVSAGVLFVRSECKTKKNLEFDATLSSLKKSAKASKEKIAIASLL